ncbi:hypothetical protein [Variovorax sp. RA8]|uniref:hypothetical protein n=1 Tax=Variovorax sp. (strain JCM 16519 / RA8) TaxID=662548 RepID=UPI00131840A3|nr:hypothetical protein [Variovorax sp. RA8]VTU19196.1 hypothetical protein RA8CHR_01880 [Variovorax sp. RA8]
MAHLAELDLAFSQPCKRCAQLLYGRVKFCPYCGGENDAPRWGDEAANTAFGPGHAASDSAEPAPSPAEELLIVPRHEAPETTDRPILEVRNEAREEADLDIAHIVPAAFEWPEELPVATTTVQPRALAPRRGPMLKYAAIGVAMAVSVLALILGYVRSGQESVAQRSKAPTAQQPQPQSAPELPTQAPRGAEVTAAVVPAPVAAVPAPVAPVAGAAPAPAVPAQEPGKAGCNEALAALALCPDTGSAR